MINPGALLASLGSSIIAFFALRSPRKSMQYILTLPKPIREIVLFPLWIQRTAPTSPIAYRWVRVTGVFGAAASLYWLLYFVLLNLHIAKY